MIYIIFYVRRKTELLILFYIQIILSLNTDPTCCSLGLYRSWTRPNKPSQYWWNNFHGIWGSSNPSINQLVQVRRGPELRVHSVFFFSCTQSWGQCTYGYRPAVPGVGLALHSTQPVGKAEARGWGWGEGEELVFKLLF